jgi:hypothetical protein
MPLNLTRLEEAFGWRLLPLRSSSAFSVSSVICAAAVAAAIIVAPMAADPTPRNLRRETEYSFFSLVISVWSFRVKTSSLSAVPKDEGAAGYSHGRWSG